MAQCSDRDDLGRHDVSGPAAAIVVANGCGDHDRVWTAVEAAIKELDPPAGHFPNEVPALALAAAIDVGGPCTVAVASDVINVTDPGSQNGSLHVWSRNLMRSASQPSKQRRLGSPPTIGPRRSA